MSKISVIVPVYNVEKYLKKSLQSLIKQSFNDIEIICINDGSTDNSLKILNDFANSDSRIKIISQENLGVSAARNRGIAEAKSEYIMFLDSDDYYTTDACQIAYEQITKQNSVIGIFGITELYKFLPLPCIVNKNIKKAVKNPADIDLWKFQTYSVNKIYKKDFLINNNLKFPTGIKTAEDTIFSLRCLFKNPQYCFIDKSLYIYRKNRKNSATAGKNCVKNDFEALKMFYNTPEFQEQNENVQLKIIEKFCSGNWNYYKRNKNNKELLTDIKILVDFIENHYEISKLKNFKKYNQIKEITSNINI